MNWQRVAGRPKLGCVSGQRAALTIRRLPIADGVRAEKARSACIYDDNNQGGMQMTDRRFFLKALTMGGVGLFLRGKGGNVLVAAIPGGTLDPAGVPKYPDAAAHTTDHANGRNDQAEGRQDR